MATQLDCKTSVVSTQNNGIHDMWIGQNRTWTKCRSVQMPHGHLWDARVGLTSVLNLVLTLPDPFQVRHSSLRFGKSNSRCSWMHLQLWRCIQDAMRIDLLYSPTLKLLRPQRKSAGDFDRRRDLCPDLYKTSYHILTAVVLRVA